VFSDIDVIQNGVEVAGMKLVRFLRGCATENRVEAVYAPSFPCKCSGFYEFHSMRLDVCYILWYDLVQCGISLLTKCFSCSALAQKTEFCSKQYPSVAFDAWKWDLLVKQIFIFFGSTLMIHNFCRAKKHLTLCKGGVVLAISSSISQSWIHLQTTEQLSALKCVFGSWCLFGLRDKAPRVGTSVLVTSTTLCNIVSMVAGAVDNVFTLRTHHFGDDLCFDCSCFRIYLVTKW
jgi:hypothetical protein